jgi:hypothetical protein
MKNRNTFAYPTKLTDPNGNFSQVRYRYDIGANVWAKSPSPVANTDGKTTTREFDNIGRPTKETLVNTGAYSRYEYPTNGVQSKVYSTITDVNNNGADSADEVLSESWADGAGRVRRSRSELPNSYGGYSGSLVEYNILGQVRRSSVPTCCPSLNQKGYIRLAFRKACSSNKNLCQEQDKFFTNRVIMSDNFYLTAYKQKKSAKL